MKTIRRCVFETNSSSCHSITIGDGSRLKTPDSDVLCVCPGEYGWGPDLLVEPEELLSYAFTMFCTVYGDNGLTYIHEAMDKVCEYFATRGVTVKFNGLYDKPDEYGDIMDGYVDHQSVKVGFANIFLDPEALYVFVYDSASEVQVDNDNH